MCLDYTVFHFKTVPVCLFCENECSCNFQFWHGVGFNSLAVQMNIVMTFDILTYTGLILWLMLIILFLWLWKPMLIVMNFHSDMRLIIKFMVIIFLLWLWKPMLSWFTRFRLIVCFKLYWYNTLILCNMYQIVCFYFSTWLMICILQLGLDTIILNFKQKEGNNFRSWANFIMGPVICPRLGQKSFLFMYWLMHKTGSICHDFSKKKKDHLINLKDLEILLSC